jgi:hypothetical protein
LARSTLRYVLLLAGMLLMAAGLTASSAAAEPHGAWHAGTHNGSPIALTINESQQALGFMCTKGQGCEWRITVKASCRMDNEYHTLAASPQGAIPLTVRCLGKLDSGEAYRYSFTDTKQVLALIAGDQDGGRVGFVIPQDDATFLVMRFSLSGAVDAIRETLTLAEKRLQVPTPSVPAGGTKDTLL